jgi:hypothetical protein
MARAKEIRDLKIDEVSLVDKGANQHAKTVIAKRHDVEEETTVPKYFNEDGDLIDLDSLADGEHVWDENGAEFVMELDDADTPENLVEEKEPELVGKSSVFAKSAKEPVSSREAIREELSKALTDKDRDEVISKFFGQLDEVAKRADEAEKAAVAERDLRLEREYTEIAKSYNVPVAAEVLGPVLKKLAETLTEAEQRVIKKCLDATTASEELFQEYGHRGGGDNVDILTQVDALVEEHVSKSGDFSREDLVSKAFEENPDAYDAYLAERGR